MDSRGISIILVALLVASIVPSALAAGYQISASDTTPIPERTVDANGKSFTVDSMVRVSSGSTISVDVTAPDEVYRVHIRNSNEEIVKSKRGDGSTSFQFDLTGYEPGSYVIAVPGGNYEKIQPLLVSGYDVSAETPSSVEYGESFDVTVAVSRTAADSSPDNVKVVVAQDGTTHTVDASKRDGQYVATIDSGELEQGEYTVHGIVQGDEEAFGQKEIMGLSNSQSLTVEPKSDTSEDSGSDTSNDKPTEDDTETTTSSNSTATESTSESSSTEDTDSEPTESESVTKTTSETSTPTATENNVITPGETTTTTVETTSGSGPGFGIVGSLAAITLLALLGRRQL